LTDKQREWNFMAHQYNDWVMQQDPNPATNIKKFRKLYKPKKLTDAEMFKVHQDFEQGLEKLNELAEDPAAYFRGSENPFIEELIKEVDDEEKF